MRNNLTKNEIINTIYMQLGFSKNVIDNIIDDIFKLILNEIIQNKKVKISNFGTFILRNKKSRIGKLSL